MSQLIITEKPSVAKDIARVLKIANRKDGYFEGNGYFISWAFGHLIRLADPPAYNPAFEKWALGQLPIIPEKFILEIQNDTGIQKQFETIKGLLLNETVTGVICATDAGREGELIFRHIYSVAGCEKPIQRLWISSQTDSAIKEGFSKLKEGAEYVPLYLSALSRSEADWIIGINATRAYTSKFSRGQGVMSVGRVQTPVLKMIVDRYLAVTNFKPEPFFDLTATFVHANGTYKGLWQSEDKLTDKTKAEALFEKIKSSDQGKIQSLTQKTVNEKPPLLYDLTELQKDANKKFKFSADHTLKVMQALYETHKLLTYPRTSSRYLSSDIKPKLTELLNNVKSLSDYAGFADAVIKDGIPISKRMFDDQKITDHHAIIPTDQKPSLAGLNADERKIYDLVIRRFLAGFMKDCVKDQTEILTETSGEIFRSFGSVIQQAGWRTIYTDDTDEEEQKLPQVKQSDPVKLKTPKLEEKKTKAPALHTEASILAAMETAGKTIEDEELRQAMKDCGLGTPATRAQILERLIKVNYIERQKNKLVPTAKGIQLISFIQTKALLSPELTGDWEKKLNDIVKKKYSRENYMKEIVEFAQEIVGGVVGATLVGAPTETCPSGSARPVECGSNRSPSRLDV